MATPTTTTATTVTTFGSCAVESDEAHAAYVFGFAALYRAWQACRRGKRGTRKAQRYETRLLDRLEDTREALQTHAWHPSRTTRFVTLHPKPREILAADFGDRVVHHLLVPWLERLYEPVFIHDSYANRKGKGTHAAVQRLQTFTRSQRGGHYLQLDIANFFHSVDRRTLYGLLQARVQRDLRQSAFATGQGVQGSFAAKAAPTAAGTVSRVGAASAANTPHAQTTPRPRHVHPGEARHMLWLARLLLTGNPAQGAAYQGRPQDLARVPAHKQLANAPDGKGLPIGNLTSQFFANVYLNELDQYIKHTLKVRHYLRYVDDFVLLHHNPAQLRQWREAIEGFLRQRLGLALRDARRLAPVANGIDFLGYIVRPGYLLVRQRVLGHLHDKLTRMGRRVQHANGSLRCPPALAAQVQAVLASYFGHLAHAKSRNAQAQVFARHPWLAHWLQPVGGTARLRRADQPAAARSLASQWRWLQKNYPGHALLVQVGTHWECAAGPLAGGATRRPGLPPTHTVPAARLPALRRQLMRAGQPWVEMAESGHLRNGRKRRQVQAVWSGTQNAVPCAAPIQ